MNKVSLTDFQNWRRDYFAQEKKNERFGQAFCNHFDEVIGRGEHTQELFYVMDQSIAEYLIHLNFLEHEEIS